MWGAISDVFRKKKETSSPLGLLTCNNNGETILNGQFVPCPIFLSQGVFSNPPNALPGLKCQSGGPGEKSPHGWDPGRLEIPWKKMLFFYGNCPPSFLIKVLCVPIWRCHLWIWNLKCWDMKPTKVQKHKRIQTLKLRTESRRPLT